jgi:hypothetical protein
VSFDAKRELIKFRPVPPGLTATGGIPIRVDYDLSLSGWLNPDARPLRDFIVGEDARRQRWEAMTPEERHIEDLRSWARNEIEKIEYEMDRCSRCGHHPDEDWCN